MKRRRFSGWPLSWAAAGWSLMPLFSAPRAVLRPRCRPPQLVLVIEPAHAADHVVGTARQRSGETQPFDQRDRCGVARVHDRVQLLDAGGVQVPHHRADRFAAEPAALLRRQHEIADLRRRPVLVDRRLHVARRRAVVAAHEDPVQPVRELVGGMPGREPRVARAQRRDVARRLVRLVRVERRVAQAVEHAVRMIRADRLEPQPVRRRAGRTARRRARAQAGARTSRAYRSKNARATVSWSTTGAG